MAKSHGGSAFMTMLGGSLGCFAAVVIVCGGLLTLGLVLYNNNPNPAHTHPSSERAK